MQTGELSGYYNLSIERPIWREVEIQTKLAQTNPGKKKKKKKRAIKPIRRAMP